MLKILEEAEEGRDGGAFSTVSCFAVIHVFHFGAFESLAPSRFETFCILMVPAVANFAEIHALYLSDSGELRGFHFCTLRSLAQGSSVIGKDRIHCRILVYIPPCREN